MSNKKTGQRSRKERERFSGYIGDQEERKTYGLKWGNRRLLERDVHSNA